MRKVIVWLFLAMFIISFVTMIATMVVLTKRFVWGCSAHILNAATTTSVEVAKRELEIAISYAEAYDLTEGNTSIGGRNPNCDIGLWYQNLKDAYNKLESAGGTTLLEESNVLMEVRESLTVASPIKMEARVPNNIWYYHYQLLLVILFVVMVLSAIAGSICSGKL